MLYDVIFAVEIATIFRGCEKFLCSARGEAGRMGKEEEKRREVDGSVVEGGEDAKPVSEF